MSPDSLDRVHLTAILPRFMIYEKKSPTVHHKYPRAVIQHHQATQGGSEIMYTTPIIEI